MSPDIFDPKKRSEIMSLIRGKNTKPERLIFTMLRKNKIHFQKHYKAKVGVRIDIARPRDKKALMIDGDFWHGRTVDKVIARRGLDDFWTRKLQRDIERDTEQMELLLNDGWQVLRVWESDIIKKKSQDETFAKIIIFLRSKD